MVIATSELQHLSFEFFPTKTDQGLENLIECAKELAGLSPDFFSVTYGAGGTTQAGTSQVVLALMEKTKVQTTPHISCISATRNEIQQQLDFYMQKGIRNLVALRGDIPSVMVNNCDEFKYGSDLVTFIREYSHDHFHIYVACYPEFHPQAANAVADLKHFKFKMECGANSAFTQYFYNLDSYFYFLDACQKQEIHAPIIPGIMPITNYTQLALFSERCSAEIPRWLKLRLEGYGNDLVSIRQFGEEIVTTLCEKLLAHGAPGLHFYTLNKAEPSLNILRNLGIKAN